MRCQKKAVEVYLTAGGGLGTHTKQCAGRLDDGATCGTCRGVRGERRRNRVPLPERFVDRVALLMEAAQQLLASIAPAEEGEEAEALRFALKQLREPKP